MFTTSPCSAAGRGQSLLDVAAGVLVADPAASLAEVAKAAGIGRTTLHKQYATRDDLLCAVGLGRSTCGSRRSPGRAATTRTAACGRWSPR